MRPLSLILLSIVFFSFSRPGDELESLDQVIALSEKQLATQKKLRHLMEDYALQQETFQKNSSKEEAAKMVEMADEILKTIEENRYESLVSSFYLQELRLFSSPLRKGGIKKP